MALLDFKIEDRSEASILGVLDGLGITLSVETDFDEFKKCVAETRPDHPVGDPFNPDLHHMTPETACWIVGRERNGTIMYLHAMRLLPTDGLSIAEYFRSSFHGFSPPELEIDFKRSRYRACPDAKRMFGRIVYFGEVWMGGQPGQHRGTGLNGLLLQYAMLVAMKQLSADHVIGFVTKPQAMKGLTLRFGFMHVDPFALRWYMPGKPDPLEGVMIYMSDEDMRYILDLPMSDMKALAA